jgi:serine/threonine-protein kinase
MPPSRIGRCAVFGELAAGGMATVYLGRLAGAAGFARRVAIKSLHAQFAKDPDFLAMFLDEARLSGRIQHPNVVRVLDVISSDNELHLVMEYIEGESLSKVVRLLRARGERVPLAIAVAILSGVLDGLHAAHEARSEDGQALEIVHRDVSPQNVLVGVDGMPRILDFGIAKAVGRMQTTRGDQLKGKLAYMAPEHLAREALDRRADVYAVAIMLWELLTGERLFQAEDEITTFRRALEGKAAPPSSLVPSVPESLDAIVLRGLARKPEQRYQTAREFSLALEATKLAATPRDLAAWLQLTAEQSLAERANRIAEYEAALGAGTASPDVGDSVSVVMPRALSERLRAEHADTAVLEPVTETKSVVTRRPRARLWLALAPAALALAAWWGWPRSAVEPTAPEVERRPSAAAPAPVPAAATVAEPVVPAATSESRRPAASASARVAPRAIRPAAAPPKKARRVGCETPFTVDARGVRVPKLECL